MAASRPFLGEADGCAGGKAAKEQGRRSRSGVFFVRPLVCLTSCVSFPTRTHRHTAGVTRQNTGSGEQSPSARSRHRQPAKSVQHTGMANGTATSTAHGMANGTATGTAHGMANGTATGVATSTAHGVANSTATSTAHGVANGTGEPVLWGVGGQHLGLRFVGENEFLLR